MGNLLDFMTEMGAVVISVDTTTAASEETEQAQAQARQRAKRQRLATILCARANNAASWQLANNQALRWDLCGCRGFGYAMPEAGRDKKDIG